MKKPTQNKIWFMCPLSGIKIQTCPVSKCIYHTEKTESKCLGDFLIGDSIDADDPNLLMLFGKRDDIAKQMKASVSRIKIIIAAHDYLEWCRKKEWFQYPFVVGYKQNKLRTYVARFAPDHYPFNITKLNWNIGLVCAMTHQVWYDEYCKERRITTGTLDKVFGLNKTTLSDLREQFIQAAEAATKQIRRRTKVAQQPRRKKRS